MRRCQTRLFKAGNQSSTDIDMRQRRPKNGAQASFHFEIKVDSREDLRSEMTCRLVKSDDASATHRPRRSPYSGDGISLVMQNVAADCSVKERALGKAFI